MTEQLQPASSPVPPAEDRRHGSRRREDHWSWAIKRWLANNVTGLALAASAGYFVHAVVARPTPPVHYIAVEPIDRDIYAGETLVLRVTMQIDRDCPATVSAAALNSDGVPTERIEIPAGFTPVGKKPRTIPWPLPFTSRLAPGSYTLRGFRIDFCTEAITSSVMPDTPFTVLERPSQ